MEARKKERDREKDGKKRTPPPLLPLLYKKALDLIGVKDVGLKGQTMFTKADLIAKRKEIIELTNRAARAGR